LTKVAQNLTDPVVDAVNANADVLDSAAIIVAARGSASATGQAGQIAFDATHIYVCGFEHLGSRNARNLLTTNGPVEASCLFRAFSFPTEK
jgi:hypothetical protein